MIKVLKEGYGEFKEAFCKYCGCEFTYQGWDVENSVIKEEFWMSINCPTCHERVYLGK